MHPRLTEICSELVHSGVSPSNLESVATASSIRKKYGLNPDDMSLVVASLRARERFGEDLLSTQAGIEQATSRALACYHAAQFPKNTHVLEIGTGIGIDTSALAAVVSHVSTVEVDETTHACAKHNFEAQGLGNITAIQSSVEEVPKETIERCNALWADPSRREKSGKRILNPKNYHPSLQFLLELPIQGIKGIKISSIADVELPSGWVREWVGFEGECKEQILWFGTDKRSDRVVIVDENGVVEWSIPEEVWRGDLTPLLASGDLKGYWLMEPHPAVLATRREKDFFKDYEASCFEPEVVYGITKSAPKISPLYAAFELMEWFPYNKKALRAKLEDLGWDLRTEFKKRNFPDEVDEVRKIVSLSEITPTSEFGTVFLTRYNKKPIIILGKRLI